MFHFLSGIIDVALQGEPPQKIVVLGDSGAGKTTFVEQCKYLLSQQRTDDDIAFQRAVGRWQETSIQRRKARSETPERVTLTTSSSDFPLHENPVLAKQLTVRPTVGLNVTKVSLASTKRVGTRQPPPQQIVPLVSPSVRRRRITKQQPAAQRPHQHRPLVGDGLGASMAKSTASLDTLPTNGSLILVSDSTCSSQRSSTASESLHILANHQQESAAASPTGSSAVSLSTPPMTPSSPPSTVNCCDVDVWGNYCSDNLVTDPGPKDEAIMDRPMVLWDLGGQEHLRTLWVNYLKQCDGVIFMVDGRVKRKASPINRSARPPMSPPSTPDSPEHLAHASALLRSILHHPALALIPVIIVSNKYDFLPERSASMPEGRDEDTNWRLVSIEELQYHLGLLDILADDPFPSASHRPVSVGVVSALEGGGVLDVLCWLSQAILRQRTALEGSHT